MARRPSIPPSRIASHRREEGIALLVVMVVFVVLYLVIYQLHFSTKMEEQITQARYGEGESTIACYSAGLFVITHLIEDLHASTQASGMAASGATGLDGTQQAGPRPVGQDSKAAGAKADTTGSFSKLGAGGTGSGAKYDSLYKNIFNDNHQQVGDISVKISIVDGERQFDLNQLFAYVHVRGEEVVAGDAAVSEEDMVSAVTGAKDDKDAGTRLAGKLRENLAKKRADRTAKSTGKASTTVAGVKKVGQEGATGAGGTGNLGDVALSDYESPEFETPDPLRVETTKKMVERAILLMFSINENRYGYRYQRSRRYDAGMMAQRIVDYVLERRSGTFQNRIYLVTELLNLCSPGGEEPGDITPEVFYGPYPRLTGDEDFPVGDGFVLERDEFGDMVPRYLYSDEESPDAEAEKLQLSQLEEQFGKFMDFGGMGLSRLAGNAITRGMKELPLATDQNGEDYVVDIPKPIGLKDLFTTYSTGKININTASEPVIAGLLQSISDEEADFVASSIRDWRQRFRAEEDETGISKVGSEKDKAGSKSATKAGARSSKDKAKSATGAGARAGTAAAGATGTGLDATGLDPSLQSSYQDLDLNYFTSIEEQLELIDGTDGGRDDVLKKDEGVKKVSEEDDTLYRKVLNDLLKVTVYSSTYFNAELKAKPKEGKSLKTGFLTVRRDLKKKIVDVVMWKNLQK